MPPSPYPLAGEARDVVEDVRRLGGFGIAAHPDSPKAELQWKGWALPFDAVEVINPDTSWRVHAESPGFRPKLRLLQAALTYPLRSSETIAGVLAQSEATAARWELLTRERRVVAVAGVDAHAKLQLRDVDPGDNRFSLPFPGYEPSFRVLSVRVYSEQPLTGDAPEDARRLIDALRNGRLYTAVDGWAAPPAFAFTADHQRGSARAGEELPIGGPVTLHIKSNAPAGFTTTVWRGSEAIAADRAEREIDLPVGDGAAVYRAEIRADDRPGAPAWITSNPIYVRGAGVPAAVEASAARRAGSVVPIFDGKTIAGWGTETDATSVALIQVSERVDGSELRFRYGLSGGAAIGQFAGAIVETATGVAPHDRVTFTIRAEHPMRVSVQARAEVKNAPPERWQRSIYVDADDRERTVLFNDMTPVGKTHAATVPLADIRSIMFVVDTTNTKPGSSGRLWLRDVRLED
jgi:hypothetical protein